MDEPPVELGAVKEMVAWPGLEVAAETEVGSPGTTAFTVYVSTDALVSPSLLVGVRVMVPAAVGVMVKVCAALELAKVRTVAESPVLADPVGVRVMVPVYVPFGVTVKFPKALFTLPDEGPVKV